MKDIRRLAHKMLNELNEDEILKIISIMREMKNKNNQMNTEANFTIVTPTSEELVAINKAKMEYESGELYTHEVVFGKED